MRISLELPDHIDEAKARELVAEVEQLFRRLQDARFVVGAVSIDSPHGRHECHLRGIGGTGPHWTLVADAALKGAAEYAKEAGQMWPLLRLKAARAAIDMDTSPLFADANTERLLAFAFESLKENNRRSAEAAKGTPLEESLVLGIKGGRSAFLF